jgi:hypothetical protein
VPGALFTPDVVGASARGDIPRHDGHPQLRGEDVDIQPDVAAGGVEDVVLGLEGEAFGHRAAEILCEGSSGRRHPDLPERCGGRVSIRSPAEAFGGGVVRDDSILAVERDDGVAQLIEHVEKVRERRHRHILA